MRLYLKIYFSILISISIYGRSYSQLVDVPHYCYGVIVSSSSTYNLNVGQFRQGLGIHGVLLVLNGSIEQPSFFIGKSNQTTAYLGFGLTNLIAVQYGFHNSVRLRSDLVFFNNVIDSPGFSDWTKIGYLRDGIVLTITIEWQNLSGDPELLPGIGIGVYF